MTFHEEWESAQEMILSQAISIARHREDAEDLVSATYIKTHQGYSSFRHNCKFSTWAIYIMRNIWADVVRKRVFVHSLEEAWLEPDPQSFTAPLMEQAGVDLLLSYAPVGRYRTALSLIAEGVSKTKAYEAVGMHRTTASRQRLGLLRGLENDKG